MLAPAILALLSFCFVWLFLALLFYSALYISLAFSYFFVWDEETRKAICPNGLLSALLRDL